MRRAIVPLVMAVLTALCLTAQSAIAQGDGGDGDPYGCGDCEPCPGNPTSVHGTCPTKPPCTGCHGYKKCTSGCIHGEGGCEDILNCVEQRFTSSLRNQTDLTGLNFDAMTPAQAVQTLQFSALQYLPGRKSVVVLTACGAVAAIIPLPERLQLAVATASGITVASATTVLPSNGPALVLANAPFLALAALR